MKVFQGSFDGRLVLIYSFTQAGAKEKLQTYLQNHGYTPSYILVSSANSEFANWASNVNLTVL